MVPPTWSPWNITTLEQTPGPSYQLAWRSGVVTRQSPSSINPRDRRMWSRGKKLPWIPRDHNNVDWRLSSAGVWIGYLIPTIGNKLSWKLSKTPSVTLFEISICSVFHPSMGRREGKYNKINIPMGPSNKIAVTMALLYSPWSEMFLNPRLCRAPQSWERNFRTVA